MNDLSKAIGGKIRRSRNQLGLTQEKLAEETGLHHTYIGQLERGEKNATMISLQKVVLALGISYADLFESIIIDSHDPSIADDCYRLISTLTPKEQKAIFDIIGKTIEYKNL